ITQPVFFSILDVDSWFATEGYRISDYGSFKAATPIGYSCVPTYRPMNVCTQSHSATGGADP
ncbi:MAG: hypothetical protein KDA66_19275, partial [Planctomycetaceae bacterium]|nr:hypothetical protein [Planctomycetaceae bacterium]